jgi:hypothetical protein
MDQVEQYNPPPNPAKVTDSRYEDYLKIYGTESWELDALNPEIISKLIHKYIDDNTDVKLLKKSKKLQLDYKNTLQHIAENWEYIE